LRSGRVCVTYGEGATETRVTIKIVVHAAEEGGYWAEVPALPGCVSQGDSMDELMANIREAIEAWVAAEEPDLTETPKRKVVELTI
jgi:predicted RNase H-like HicB family nuclease